MKKKIIIAASILLLVIIAVSILWSVFDLSSDYNYATAKIDIRNGEVKLIHVGAHKNSSKDNEIELVASRFGFQNIYIEQFTKEQTEKGIKDYNKLIDTYLSLRNGFNWKDNYQREVDSLYKIAAIEDSTKVQ
jgi:hypothetical protein